MTANHLNHFHRLGDTAGMQMSFNFIRLAGNWFIAMAVGLLAGGLFLSAATVGAAQLPLPPVLLPYLQNPTADGMTICFLAQGAERVTVAWHPAGAAAATETTASGTPVPGTPWTIWKTRLTRLSAGAEYQYHVRYQLAGQAEQTPFYSFRALNPAAKTVRFAAFNDVHNHTDTLAALMRHVQPADYEFSLLLGDMWTNPDPKDQAEEVFRTLEAYVRLLDAPEKPMILVRGNHETIGGFADKMALLFDLPSLEASAAHADQNWYFPLRAGPVWFLGLDGGDDFIKRYELFQPIRQRQAAWLQQQLAGSPDTNAAWRVVLTHMPLYNDNIWNSEPCRQMWEPILKDARITVELSGHDHDWKLIPAGKTYTIHFDGHYPDQQDPQQRKSYSYIAPFPVLIGGGPSLREGSVMLVTADEKQFHARLLAAQDGRQLVEFNSSAQPDQQGVKPGQQPEGK